MSRVFRESGKSGRVAQFCEQCGKVAGPLPFGRGDVQLTMTLDGSYCDACIPPAAVEHIHAYTKPAVTAITRTTRRKQETPADLQLFFDWIKTL
jgi:hypothetical protein